MKGGTTMTGSAKDRIALYGHIADLKEDMGHNLLLILSLIHVLENKGLVSPGELEAMALELDKAEHPPGSTGLPCTGQLVMPVPHPLEVLPNRPLLAGVSKEGGRVKRGHVGDPVPLSPDSPVPGDPEPGVQ